MKCKTYYIYVIQNKINLCVYIGQTVNPKRRWVDHKWLSKNKPEQYIHRVMAKYSIDNFIFQIIDQTDNPIKIGELEIDWISYFKSRDKQYGYNLSPGGDVAWNRGLPSEQQPMYGKQHSEESKQKISNSNMGKVMPPHTNEWKVNQSKIMTGRIIDDNWKDKLSNANKGKLRSDETKQKISNAKIGSSYSLDTKSKMSKSHLGIKKSDETKQKMSDSKSGESAPQAKLTNELVSQIIDEYNSNQFTQKELAFKYNITDSCINNLLKNKTWKNVNKPKITKLLSDVSRQRMSESHKNKVFSNTTKNKMSAANIGNKKAAKLNWDIVNSIREKYSNGVTKEELAEEFEISKINIYYIVTNRSWKINKML